MGKKHARNGKKLSKARAGYKVAESMNKKPIISNGTQHADKDEDESF